MATALWLKTLSPRRSVSVFELDRLGSGASNRAGGLVLHSTLSGDLSHVGNVLDSFLECIERFQINCDLNMTNVLQLTRRPQMLSNPVNWDDHGKLHLQFKAPGGVADPGKLLTGLAAATEEIGVLIHEKTPVSEIQFGNELVLRLSDASQLVKAGQVVVAVNGSDPDFNLWGREASTMFTAAVLSEPMTSQQWSALETEGLNKPFFTLDDPHLWGRPFHDKRYIFGGGDIDVSSREELRGLSFHKPLLDEYIRSLHKRVRALHPSLANLGFTSHWGGPIQMTPNGQPILSPHPKSDKVLVMGGCCGHGLTLSFHLARIAADILLERRNYPEWGIRRV